MTRMGGRSLWDRLAARSLGARSVGAQTVGIALAALLGCEAAVETSAETLSEQAVEALVRAMAAAIPDRNPRAILDRVGHDFVAAHESPSGGTLDYAGVQALVNEFLSRERIYTAELEELHVAPGAGPSQLDVHTRVRFGAADDVTRSVRYRIDVVFVNLAGSWTARRGRYARVAP